MFKRILICALFVSVAIPAIAQDATTLFRQHQYTAVIGQLQEKGIDNLTGTEQATLGMAHLRRASLYSAGYELQRDAGLQLFTARQNNRQAVKTPYHAYFFGRYLLENGRYADAQTRLKEAAGQAKLPGAFKTRAQTWQAASAALSGGRASWPGAGAGNQGDLMLAKWKAGERVSPGCSGRAQSDAAAARCAVWNEAVLAKVGNAALIASLTESLPADAKHPVEDLTFTYYDPATLEVLALADYNAALQLLSSIPEQRGSDQIKLNAGIAAYELKRFDEAVALLNATNADERHVYLGAVEMEKGNRAAADRHWVVARAGGQVTTISWAAIASRYAAMRDDVARTVNPLEENTFANRMDVQRLSSALINVGRHEQAFGLLLRHYPATTNNNLNAVSPAFLMGLTHARFLEGRSEYSMVNGHLHALIERFPALLGVVDVVKSVTVPNASTGKIITEN